MARAPEVSDRQTLYEKATVTVSDQLLMARTHLQMAQDLFAKAGVTPAFNDEIPFLLRRLRPLIRTAKRREAR